MTETTTAATLPKETKTGVLDADIPLHPTNMRHMLTEARKTSGKTFGQMLKESLRLTFSAQRLEDNEYFKYRLYEIDDPDLRRRYVGENQITKINSSLNQFSEFLVLSDDKIVFEALMRGGGVLTTHTEALFGTSRYERLRNVQLLKSPALLREFLTETARYPLFGKPIGGLLSLGSIGIRSFDKKTGTLNLINGTGIDVEQFIAEVEEKFFENGYLFQDLIRIAPELESFCGKAVGTVRIGTLITEDGLKPTYAAWKLPRMGSMADNFWRADNMIANIDIETGMVTRCQLGSGVDRVMITAHPDTGAEIVGYTFPHWQDMLDAALHAAALMPSLRIIGFDVALSDKGPVIVEANANPDHGLFQLASGTGLLSPEFERTIAWNRQQLITLKRQFKQERRKLFKDHTKRGVIQRFKDFQHDIDIK